MPPSDALMLSGGWPVEYGVNQLFWRCWKVGPVLSVLISVQAGWPSAKTAEVMHDAQSLVSWI